MSRLLVTGGAGFIGANFVHHWRQADPGGTIVVLDALTYAGNRANLDGADPVGTAGLELVVGDICDTPLVGRLIADHAIDTIVNFAAESHVDRSIAGPDAFVTTNVVGTHSLLKAAKAAWLDRGSGTPHRFHHVSTDEVYGSLEADEAAFREDTAYAPNSPYAASKAAADHLVRAYHRTYGLETTTSNCSNNYGPFQFPEKLIPLTMLNALSGRALPIYGDGSNVRDWLHVEDHCRAIALILRGGRPGETYNVGGGEELANIAVVGQICDLLGRSFAQDRDLARRHPDCPAAQGRHARSLMTFVADRKGHDRRYAIDDAKIRAELGYMPRRGFAAGLAETLAWYLDHREWWRPLLDRK